MIEPLQMTSMPSGGSSAWVHVDANAAIDYIRECALHDLGIPPTGRKPDMLRRRLGQVSHVFVAETASKEAQRNLRKDIAQKLGRSGINRVTGHAQKLIREYCLAAKCDDYLGHVSAAREMYAAASSDPSSLKFSEWKRKKSVRVDNPVLGSRNDLRILSTAAHHAQQHAVELWTHDMDFTMFADEIGGTFGVKVVDTYSLGD